VGHFPVFAELFAVVGTEGDGGVSPEIPATQTIEQPTDLIVKVS
jgi:hypothetical protein